MIGIALWLSTKFPLLWRIRRVIAYALLLAALVAALAWYRHSLISAGIAQGEARIEALWKADTEARDEATAKAIADQKMREDAAKSANEVILADYNEKLIAAAGERDTVFRLLQQARGQVRGLSAGKASSDTIAADFAGIASRAEEVDRRLAEYDSACVRDSLKLEALQGQIRGQL